MKFIHLTPDDQEHISFHQGQVPEHVGSRTLSSSLLTYFISVWCLICPQLSKSGLQQLSELAWASHLSYSQEISNIRKTRTSQVTSMLTSREMNDVIFTGCGPHGDLQVNLSMVIFLLNGYVSWFWDIHF